MDQDKTKMEAMLRSLLDEILESKLTAILSSILDAEMICFFVLVVLISVLMMFTMVVINLNLYCLAELDLVIRIIEFDCDQFIIKLLQMA